MSETMCLLDEDALERSSVVANAGMNRERGLSGVNSYARDLAFDPLDHLRQRLQAQDEVAWLDLCCGAGKALVEAAQHLDGEGLGSRVTIVGVDLVPLFCSQPPGLSFLQREAASLSAWQPQRRFDLITCVHGLHYIGDKLGLLERAASWLKEDGLFLAHLDLSNVFVSGKTDPRGVLKALRQAGFEYHRRRHILERRGSAPVAFGWRYVGADDAAGPNFSGQPGVNSYYELSARAEH